MTPTGLAGDVTDPGMVEWHELWCCCVVVSGVVFRVFFHIIFYDEQRQKMGYMKRDPHKK